MQMSRAMDTENGMIVKRVSVPIGLEELMEGLTKEVLLKKPKDLCQFAADYFSHLLVLRQKGSYKASRFRTARSATKQISKEKIEQFMEKSIKENENLNKHLLKQSSIKPDVHKIRYIKKNPPSKIGEKNVTALRSSRKENLEPEKKEINKRSPRSLSERKVENEKEKSVRNRSLSNKRDSLTAKNNLASPRNEKENKRSTSKDKENKKAVEDGKNERNSNKKIKVDVLKQSIEKTDNNSNKIDNISNVIAPAIGTGMSTLVKDNTSNDKLEKTTNKSIEGTASKDNTSIDSESESVISNVVVKADEDKNQNDKKIHKLTKDGTLEISQDNSASSNHETSSKSQSSEDAINSEEIAKFINNDNRETGQESFSNVETPSEGLTISEDTNKDHSIGDTEPEVVESKLKDNNFVDENLITEKVHSNNIIENKKVKEKTDEKGKLIEMDTSNKDSHDNELNSKLGKIKAESINENSVTEKVNKTSDEENKEVTVQKINDKKIENDTELKTRENDKNETKRDEIAGKNVEEIKSKVKDEIMNLKGVEGTNDKTLHPGPFVVDNDSVKSNIENNLSAESDNKLNELKENYLNTKKLEKGNNEMKDTTVEIKDSITNKDKSLENIEEIGGIFNNNDVKKVSTSKGFVSESGNLENESSLPKKLNDQKETNVSVHSKQKKTESMQNEEKTKMNTDDVMKNEEHSLRPASIEDHLQDQVEILQEESKVSNNTKEKIEQSLINNYTKLEEDILKTANDKLNNEKVIEDEVNKVKTHSETEIIKNSAEKLKVPITESETIDNVKNIIDNNQSLSNINIQGSSTSTDNKDLNSETYRHSEDNLKPIIEEEVSNKKQEYTVKDDDNRHTKIEKDKLDELEKESEVNEHARDTKDITINESYPLNSNLHKNMLPKSSNVDKNDKHENALSNKEQSKSNNILEMEISDSTYRKVDETEVIIKGPVTHENLQNNDISSPLNNTNKHSGVLSNTENQKVSEDVNKNEEDLIKIDHKDDKNKLDVNNQVEDKGLPETESNQRVDDKVNHDNQIEISEQESILNKNIQGDEISNNSNNKDQLSSTTIDLNSNIENQEISKDHNKDKKKNEDESINQGQGDNKTKTDLKTHTEIQVEKRELSKTEPNLNRYNKEMSEERDDVEDKCIEHTKEATSLKQNEKDSTDKDDISKVKEDDQTEKTEKAHINQQQPTKESIPSDIKDGILKEESQPNNSKHKEELVESKDGQGLMYDTNKTLKENVKLNVEKLENTRENREGDKNEIVEKGPIDTIIRNIDISTKALKDHDKIEKLSNGTATEIKNKSKKEKLNNKEDASLIHTNVEDKTNDVLNADTKKEADSVKQQANEQAVNDNIVDIENLHDNAKTAGNIVTDSHKDNVKSHEKIKKDNKNIIEDKSVDLHTKEVDLLKQNNKDEAIHTEVKDIVENKTDEVDKSGEESHIISSLTDVNTIEKIMEKESIQSSEYKTTPNIKQPVEIQVEKETNKSDKDNEQNEIKPTAENEINIKEEHHANIDTSEDTLKDLQKKSLKNENEITDNTDGKIEVKRDIQANLKENHEPPENVTKENQLDINNSTEQKKEKKRITFDTGPAQIIERRASQIHIPVTPIDETFKIGEEDNSIIDVLDKNIDHVEQEIDQLLNAARKSAEEAQSKLGLKKDNVESPDLTPKYLGPEEKSRMKQSISIDEKLDDSASIREEDPNKLSSGILKSQSSNVKSDTIKKETEQTPYTENKSARKSAEEAKNKLDLEKDNVKSQELALEDLGPEGKSRINRSISIGEQLEDSAKIREEDPNKLSNKILKSQSSNVESDTTKKETEQTSYTENKSARKSAEEANNKLDLEKDNVQSQELTPENLGSEKKSRIKRSISVDEQLEDSAKITEEDPNKLSSEILKSQSSNVESDTIKKETEQTSYTENESARKSAEEAKNKLDLEKDNAESQELALEDLGPEGKSRINRSISIDQQSEDSAKIREEDPNKLSNEILKSQSSNVESDTIKKETEQTPYTENKSARKSAEEAKTKLDLEKDNVESQELTPENLGSEKKSRIKRSISVDEQLEDSAKITEEDPNKLSSEILKSQSSNVESDTIKKETEQTSYTENKPAKKSAEEAKTKLDLEKDKVELQELSPEDLRSEEKSRIKRSISVDEQLEDSAKITEEDPNKLSSEILKSQSSNVESDTIKKETEQTSYTENESARKSAEEAKNKLDLEKDNAESQELALEDLGPEGKSRINRSISIDQQSEDSAKIREEDPNKLSSEILKSQSSNVESDTIKKETEQTSYTENESARKSAEEAKNKLDLEKDNAESQELALEDLGPEGKSRINRSISIDQQSEDSAKIREEDPNKLSNEILKSQSSNVESDTIKKETEQTSYTENKSDKKSVEEAKNKLDLEKDNVESEDLGSENKSRIKRSISVDEQLKDISKIKKEDTTKLSNQILKTQLSNVESGTIEKETDRTPNTENKSSLKSDLQTIKQRIHSFLDFEKLNVFKDQFTGAKKSEEDSKNKPERVNHEKDKVDVISDTETIDFTSADRKPEEDPGIKRPISVDDQAQISSITKPQTEPEMVKNRIISVEPDTLKNETEHALNPENNTSLDLHTIKERILSFLDFEKLNVFKDQFTGAAKTEEETENKPEHLQREKDDPDVTNNAETTNLASANTKSEEEPGMKPFLSADDQSLITTIKKPQIETEAVKNSSINVELHTLSQETEHNAEKNYSLNLHTITKGIISFLDFEKLNVFKDHLTNGGRESKEDTKSKHVSQHVDDTNNTELLTETKSKEESGMKRSTLTSTITQSQIDELSNEVFKNPSTNVEETGHTTNPEKQSLKLDTIKQGIISFLNFEKVNVFKGKPHNIELTDKIENGNVNKQEEFVNSTSTSKNSINIKAENSTDTLLDQSNVENHNTNKNIINIVEENDNRRLKETLPSENSKEDIVTEKIISKDTTESSTLKSSDSVEMPKTLLSEKSEKVDHKDNNIIIENGTITSFIQNEQNNVYKHKPIQEQQNETLKFENLIEKTDEILEKPVISNLQREEECKDDVLQTTNAEQNKKMMETNESLQDKSKSSDSNSKKRDVSDFQETNMFANREKQSTFVGKAKVPETENVKTLKMDTTLPKQKIKTKSLSQDHMKAENNAKKLTEENKVKRIKSIDVIKTETKHEFKSRIPTADRRKRSEKRNNSKDNISPRIKMGIVDLNKNFEGSDKSEKFDQSERTPKTPKSRRVSSAKKTKNETKSNIIKTLTTAKSLDAMHIQELENERKKKGFTSEEAESSNKKEMKSKNDKEDDKKAGVHDKSVNKNITNGSESDEVKENTEILEKDNENKVESESKDTQINESLLESRQNDVESITNSDDKNTNNLTLQTQNELYEIQHKSKVENNLSLPKTEVNEDENNVQSRASFVKESNEKHKTDEEVTEETTSTDDKSILKVGEGNINGKSENRQITKLIDNDNNGSTVFDRNKLNGELIQIHDESKLTTFKTSYNPYKLRMEIKNASKQEDVQAKPDQNFLSDVTAALRIQSYWRKYKKHKNKGSLINTKENLKAHNEDKEITTDEFQRAVITIQKLWRGFKIRKLKSEGNLFGYNVRSEEKNEEVLKSPSTGRKKNKETSALKIQSLWRGYKVRRNIEEMQKKLGTVEDDLKNPDEKKIMTNHDMMKAATKIQAGVRGYLQRKKLNTKKNSLLSIDEDLNMETGVDESKKLTDEEILNTLKQLDKIEVPNESISNVKTWRPRIARSVTVDEPEHIRKQVTRLTTSHSEDLYGNDDDLSSSETDNNNNVEIKQGLTALENEVKQAVDHINSSLNHDENKSGIKKTDVTLESTRYSQEKQNSEIENTDENIIKSQGVTTTPTTLDQDILTSTPINQASLPHEIQTTESTNKQTTNSTRETTSDVFEHAIDSNLNKQDVTNKLPINTGNNYDPNLISNESYENAPTRPLTSDTEVPLSNENKHKAVNDRIAINSSDTIKQNDTASDEIPKSDIKQLNGLKQKDINLESGNKEKTNALKEDLSVEESDDRPISIDSSDSADTVILNENYNEKKAKDDLQKSKINNDPIQQYIDSISVGDHASTNIELQPTVNLFDIAQLRRELTEAGLIHSKETFTSFDGKTDKGVEDKNNAAATKIQSMYRGYRVRRNIEDTNSVRKHETASQLNDAISSLSKSKSGESLSLAPILEEQDSISDGQEGVKTRLINNGVKLDSRNEIKLLHTGEFHDTVVIPLSIGSSQNPAEAASKESNAEVIGNGRNAAHVDSSIQTTPPQTQDGAGHDGSHPLDVHNNATPAGPAFLTSERPSHPDNGSHVERSRNAHSQLKSESTSTARATGTAPGINSHAEQGMDSQKKDNAQNADKKMEVEAATKIQAGFRGYQVRKQLKQKNGSSDIINQRRAIRRKSSGRNEASKVAAQAKPQEPPKDLEEKSAVKIQAGVRGFLVRRRQKKQTKQNN